MYMYMYMSVYFHIYIYVCIYVYIYMYMYMCMFDELRLEALAEPVRGHEPWAGCSGCQLVR